MKSLSNSRKSDLIIGPSIVADSDIAFDKGLPPGLLLYFAFKDDPRFKEVAID